MDYEKRDREILAAYGCLEGTGGDYTAVHYARYLETLAFAGDLTGRRVLELGGSPPYAFTALLLGRFPGLDLSLAQNEAAVPGPGSARVELEPRRGGSFPRHSLATAQFNAEREVWPYEASSFDVVFCMEILEHLLLDPCRLFRESHRVLRPGGRLIVTTPNLACQESLAALLENRSPHRYGIYSQHGEYGRHNREYVPNEVRRLGESCGFDTEELRTADIYPLHPIPRRVRCMLWLLRDDPAGRRQNIFYRGRRSDRPFAPYPSELFDFDPTAHVARMRLVEPPRPLAAGDGWALSVEVTNAGTHTWQSAGDTPTRLGAQLLDEGGALVARDFVRAALPGPVAPGESVILELGVPASSSGAGLRLKLDMVEEQVCWFSDLSSSWSQSLDITIPAGQVPAG